MSPKETKVQETLSCLVGVRAGLSSLLGLHFKNVTDKEGAVSIKAMENVFFNGDVRWHSQFHNQSYSEKAKKKI